MANETRNEQTPSEEKKGDYEEPSLLDVEDLEDVSGGHTCGTGGSVSGISPTEA